MEVAVIVIVQRQVVQQVKIMKMVVRMTMQILILEREREEELLMMNKYYWIHSLEKIIFLMLL